MPENISDKLADQYTARAVNLQRFTEHVRLRTLGYLEQLERELVALLRETDPTAPALTKFRRMRLEQMLTDARVMIAGGYRDMRAASASETRPIVRSEGEFVERSINTAVTADITSVRFTPETVNSIMRDTLIEGAPSREWWARQSADLTRSFTDQMRQGVLQGEPLQTLVRRVRGTATGKRNVYWIGDTRRVFVEFSGGIMDTGTRQAEALVRTSVQAISNEARLQSLQQNADVVRGVQALVTLDNRTSTICIARSSAAWDLESGRPISGTSESFPGPPSWHWQCRSTLIPLLYSWSQLSRRDLPKRKKKRLDAVSESTQASMDGQVAADLSYEQWLRRKPKKTQIEVLGPTKYELWREDQLTFTDLISQTGRPLTVKELEAKN